MSQDFIPFALPDIGEEEIAEVVDSLRSGWITTGPKCKRFEQDFARFLGGGLHAVAVNSATAGLHLALEAIGNSMSDLMCQRNSQAYALWMKRVAKSGQASVRRTQKLLL